MTDIRDFLKEPTVIVLGAGASKPYGFPLGVELKQMMIDLVNSTPQKTWTSFGFSPKTITNFKEALQYSYLPTIDIFLEKKTAFREFGSYVIAKTLMPLEQPSNLFPMRDWYSDLFTSFDFENEIPDISNLSVVTLNYDRSFEHFLTKNIDYNCHDQYIQSAHKKLDKITIVHAHGSLGEYPTTPYGLNSNDLPSLEKAASRIKIISDKLEDSADFQKAQDMISKAHNIMFLGFGYNERTLKALLAKTNLNDKQIIGTDRGIDNTAKQSIRAFFNNRIKLGSGMTCMDFLRHLDQAQ